MKFSRTRIATLSVTAALLLMGTSAAAQAHAHIGHTADKWSDTPDQAGLLPTTQAEAEIAAQHARLATSRPDDLASIKVHIGHVLHAIDPGAEPSGPGKGYGVIKAASGVATHIRLAAKADDASENVKLHATHVATSADNVAKWAERIVELCNQAKATEDLSAAAAAAEEIQALTQAILGGRDDNGDGQVSWGENEGGLEQAAFHLNLMKRGEGID